MIPMLARVDARYRVLLAWTILCCAALVVMVPVAVSAVGLVDAWQRAHALRTDVAALSQRVYDHFDEVTAWYEAKGETEDSVREYSNPDLARQALDADLDLFSQALIEAGAHLLQAPTSRETPLGDDSAELVGEVAFSGALGDVLRAFIALEHTDINLSGLTIEALPGESPGRVRGRAELRHAYLMVSADES